MSELRRRNVLRMAALYAVAAWLIMQVAGVLIDLGALPGWSGFWVLAVLAVGLPIALICSWFYELTSEGVALDKDVPEGEFTKRRMDFIVIAILSAGLILFAGDKWWPRDPLETSIAVLPFENMSADPAQEFFSDGISDEIMNLLAHIQPLKVIARTSSFSFKGKDADIATMAEQLNVRYIIEGSVRHSGQRVRINAQLIDTKDSSQLWSQTFDRDYSAEDLFYIQSEIARAIAGELRMTLTADNEQRLANVPTTSTEAYTAYLLGRQRLTDRKMADMLDAVEQFSRAIELDPNFAGAYSGLADACYILEAQLPFKRNEKCPPTPVEREQLARKAIELDPESGEAWTTLGSAIEQQTDRHDRSPESVARLREAIAAYERGLELSPNLSQGYHWYAIALMSPALYPDPPMGWKEAWEAGVWHSVIDRGLEVDPLSIQLHFLKSIYPWHTRTKEEAIEHAQRIVEIAPDSPRGYGIMGYANWELYGRIDEFIRWQSKAMELEPSNPVYIAEIGQAYATLGDVEMALAWFDRAMQILPPQGKDSLHEALLISKARAWLASKDESSLAKARAILDESDVYSEQRFEIEASLVDGADQAAAMLGKYAEINPDCVVAEIDDESEWCPHWVDRLDQILGNQERAQHRTSIRLESGRPWYEAWPDDLKSRAVLTDLALLGRQDEALGILENLVKKGWRGDWGPRGSTLGFWLYHDVTLDGIRYDARFQALVDEIETDLAEQLENVREMEATGELPTLEDLRQQLGESTH